MLSGQRVVALVSPDILVKEQKRRKLAAEIRIILSVPWQVLFMAANGESHSALRDRIWVWSISCGGDICFKLLIVASFTPKLNWSSRCAVISCLLLSNMFECDQKLNFPVKLGKWSYYFVFLGSYKVIEMMSLPLLHPILWYCCILVILSVWVATLTLVLFISTPVCCPCGAVVSWLMMVELPLCKLFKSSGR